MFGKILLTVAVVAVIWFAFRYFARVAQVRERTRNSQGGNDRRPSEPAADIQAETMVECRVCGTWQPARGAKACGRADCPY